MRFTGQEIKEIRVTGGGARNSVWCQILSDIFNLSQNSIKSAWCSKNTKKELNSELTQYYKRLVN